MMYQYTKYYFNGACAKGLVCLQFLPYIRAVRLSPFRFFNPDDPDAVITYFNHHIVISVAILALLAC